MRVLFLGSGMLPIPPPGWGAVERAIYELSKALEGLGVSTAILNRDGAGRSLDEYRFALGLRGRLKGQAWDVLHASTPVVGTALSLRHIPYVYTSHSRHWFGTRGPTQWWGFSLERRAARRAVRTIALTKEVANRMAQGRGGVPRRQISVIPNGVDTAHFKPEWGNRKGDHVLGVGAVHPRKRWDVAVRAVAGVKGVRLTLVGPIQDRAYAERLKGLAGEARLRLTGEVPEEELRRLYASSDLFILPSSSELMSLAVMEAMSSGLPVAGTTILQGLVEGGKNGELIDRGLDEASASARFAGILEDLLQDGPRRRSLGEDARRKAVDSWGWDSVARRTLEMYRDLLKEGPQS